MTWLKAAPWLALLLVALGYASERRTVDALTARLAARDRSIAALTHAADSLRAVVRVDTVRVDSLVERWRVIAHHDTLPGRVDTLPVFRYVVAQADTAIAACQRTVADCTRLAATERARADSLAADVADWQKVAAGPWLVPRVGLTTGSRGLAGLGELQLGRGRMIGLAQLTVPLTTAPEWRAGLLVTF